MTRTIIHTDQYGDTFLARHTPTSNWFYIEISDKGCVEIHKDEVPKFLADLRSALLPDATPERPADTDAGSLLLQVRNVIDAARALLASPAAAPAEGTMADALALLDHLSATMDAGSVSARLREFVVDLTQLADDIDGEDAEVPEPDLGAGEGGGASWLTAAPEAEERP